MKSWTRRKHNTKKDEKKSAIRKIVLVSVIAKKENQSLREGDNMRFEISIKSGIYSYILSKKNKKNDENYRSDSSQSTV